MKRKPLTILLILTLTILPFLLSFLISPYSPYVDTNSFQRYVLIWLTISIIIISIVLQLFNNSHRGFERKPPGDLLLFLLICPLFGIYGLASAPDLSLNMLKHPEREHFRYSLLFIALILFVASILFLFRKDSLKLRKETKWIMTLAFIIAFAEYSWEFTHHYLYPEALKEWISQGKNAETFDKNYDNFTIITIGAVGRFFQFTSAIWLSLHLYNLQRINRWSPIITTTFGLLGIVSAAAILATHFNVPKGFEFIYIFFIPGIPFFLLYWLGIALLTKFRHSENVLDRQG